MDKRPGDAGDAINGDFDLTESVLDLKVHRITWYGEETQRPCLLHGTAFGAANIERFEQAEFTEILLEAIPRMSEEAQDFCFQRDRALRKSFPVVSVVSRFTEMLDEVNVGNGKRSES